MAALVVFLQVNAQGLWNLAYNFKTSVRSSSLKFLSLKVK
jgi:hypothetical protein